MQLKRGECSKHRNNWHKTNCTHLGEHLDESKSTNRGPKGVEEEEDEASHGSPGGPRRAVWSGVLFTIDW